MTHEQIQLLERESERARWARIVRRDQIVILILALLLAASLVYTIYMRSQFETVTTTQEVEQVAEDGGENRFIGGDYYGDDAEGQDNDD